MMTIFIIIIIITIIYAALQKQNKTRYVMIASPKGNIKTFPQAFDFAVNRWWNLYDLDLQCSVWHYLVSSRDLCTIFPCVVWWIFKGIQDHALMLNSVAKNIRSSINPLFGWSLMFDLVFAPLVSLFPALMIKLMAAINIITDTVYPQQPLSEVGSMMLLIS